MKSLILSLSVFIAAPALAGAPGDGPSPVSSNPDATALAGAAALSESAAYSSASASNRSENSAVADGGDSDSRSRSSNTVNTNVERNVPVLVMGTVIPVDCGFGGQAGAADRNGAGFLGASWTTDKCYTLKVANAFAATGAYVESCELWKYVARRALKRTKTEIDCTKLGEQLRADHSRPIIVEHDVNQTPIVGSSEPGITRKELQETVERAFKQAQSK